MTKNSHSHSANSTLLDMIKGFISPFLNRVKENSSSDFLKLALIGVAVLLIASILLSFIVPKGGADYFLYSKDDQIYCGSSSSAKGSVLTNDRGLEQSALISSDGKLVFYKDNNGKSLYFKKTSNLKKKPTLISDDVFEYSISFQGDIVAYIRGNDRDLVLHKVGGNDLKIDNSVTQFYFAKDGSRVLYNKFNTNGTSELWYFEGNGDPVPVMSDIESIYNLSDNCDSFLFLKDKALYEYKVGKEPEQILENCSNVVATYDSGEFYYSCFTPDSNTLNPSLYYYDGKKSSLISETYSGYFDSAVNNPVLIYYSLTEQGNRVTEVAVKGKVKKLDYVVDSAYTNADGSLIYFIADVESGMRQGNLYKASVSGKSVKRAKKVDMNVHDGWFLDDDKFIYFTNFDFAQNVGDLHLNNKKVIATSVPKSNVFYNYFDEKIVFFTDINGVMGSLNISGGGKPKVVADNVYIGQIFITERGEIVYLKDYDGGIGRGNLYLCKKYKGKLVANDVSSIIKYDTNNSKYAKDNGYSE